MCSILITGDIHLGGRDIAEMAVKKEAKILFGDFLPIIENVDFSITNLESPVIDNGTPIEKTGPPLKSPIKSLSVLKKAGFNLLTMANNHIMDYGKDGMKSTILECANLNLNYVGVGHSYEEARKPFVFRLKDFKISIINIAENEFSTIGNQEYGANPMDPINNSHDIRKAKEETDIVIVIVHGGREHYQLPSPNFQKTLRFYSECGADAVVAHHISGYEIYNGVPIFYGLGNFLFNKANSKDDPLWHSGLGLKLNIDDNCKIDFQLFPYYQCRGIGNFIELIKGPDRKALLNKIEDLNRIIASDKLVMDHWRKYIESQKKHYKRHLFIKNKWLKKLINRNIIPENLLTNRKHITLVTT